MFSHSPASFYELYSPLAILLLEKPSIQIQYCTCEFIRIIPESFSTTLGLKSYENRYIYSLLPTGSSTPVTFIISTSGEEGERADSAHDGWICFYEIVFKIGLKLLFHRIFDMVLDHFNFAHGRRRQPLISVLDFQPTQSKKTRTITSKASQRKPFTSCFLKNLSTQLATDLLSTGTYKQNLYKHKLSKSLKFKVGKTNWPTLELSEDKGGNNKSAKISSGDDEPEKDKENSKPPTNIGEQNDDNLPKDPPPALKRILPPLKASFDEAMELVRVERVGLSANVRKVSSAVQPSLERLEILWTSFFVCVVINGRGCDWDNMRFLAKQLDVEALHLVNLTTKQKKQEEGLKGHGAFKKNTRGKDNESLRLNLGVGLACIEEPIFKPNKKVHFGSPAASGNDLTISSPHCINGHGLLKFVNYSGGEWEIEVNRWHLSQCREYSTTSFRVVG
ncbi:hypothetical protein FNV43_RR24651 [Rhamnella rubrinervis]|uniref:Uncharacterized protein n=1 Tax=Rhamnella rubrinervis TaxID=2594499 RepID=A0A8K0DSZ5_9ROSA|nr:hypothetical protein FNV43_RR24651 [Rhamnella rubrinervis]